MPVLLRVLISLTGLLEAAITVLAIVTRTFSLVVRSNVNLISNTLLSKDRDHFTDKIIVIRILFQQINKVAAVASIKNPQSRTATLVQLRRILVLASVSTSVSRQASTTPVLPALSVAISII